MDLPAGPLYALLSRDNKFVAMSSTDYMGRVFELTPDAPREVWHLPLTQDDFFPMAFTSMDKYVLLATGSHALVVKRRLWHAQDLIERACDLLQRNLTSEEWRGFSSDTQPKTCSNLP